MESSPPSKKSWKLQGLQLPNLYVLLDIFSFAFPPVSAPARFRSLNSLCSQFFISNKSYLQLQISQSFDLDNSSEIPPRLTSYNIDFYAYSLLQNTTVLLMNFDPSVHLSEEMIKLKIFRVQINAKAITGVSQGQDSKIKELQHDQAISHKVLYPPFLTEDFFYSDYFDTDIGNKKMERVHSDFLLQRIIGIEFLSHQLMAVIYAILMQYKQSNKNVQECLARSEDVFQKYAPLVLPKFIDKYLCAHLYTLNKLQQLSVVFLSLQDFEQYLLVFDGVQKSKIVMPLNLQCLSLKINFLEFMADDYYSDQLIPQALKSNIMREFVLEVQQLTQIKIFESTLSKINEISPSTISIILKNQGLNKDNDLNKNYYPIDAMKMGFKKVQCLKLQKIPLKAADLIGFIGKLHSFTTNLVHLDINGCFNEELLDLREFIKQPSIIQIFKINQWICCDETFCGYFGHLRELKLSLKNFSFMKRMKYPGTLRVLEIELEALTKSFLDGIRENAQQLEDLTIKFAKIDATVVEDLNQFQLELAASNITGEEGKTPAEQRMPVYHNLKRLTLINLLRSNKVPFSIILDLVLELDPVIDASSSIRLIPFASIEFLQMQKIEISDIQSTMKFQKYLFENTKLKHLKVQECLITSNFMKKELSNHFADQLPHLQTIEIDLGPKLLFIGDQINKVRLISDTLQHLRLKAFFETPNCIMNLLRQLHPKSCLSKLEIDYMGTEGFTNAALKGIMEVLGEGNSSNSQSLKTMKLTMPRELFKVNFDRTLREADFNNVRVFQLVVIDE